MDILDPDVSYSEPTTIRDRAILAIWIILWICIAGAGVIIVCAMPVQAAAEINPSVDTIPFQCRFTYTKWLCDDKAGPAGARGINGTPGTPGAGNFSAIYYNASNFTAYQNTTLIFGNITTGNNTINSNYTVIQGASFFNTTAINESYAYLPGRQNGQVLTGGTQDNEDLTLNGTTSPIKATSNVILQSDGGYVVIGEGDRSTSYNALLSLSGNQSYTTGGSLLNIIGNMNMASNGDARFVNLLNNNIGYGAVNLAAVRGLFLAGSTWVKQNSGTIDRTVVVNALLPSIGTANSVIVIGTAPYSGNWSIYSAINNPSYFAYNVSIGTDASTAQFDTTGTVRFRNYGAGTLNTDSLGRLYVSSDEKLKSDIKPYTGGLSKLAGTQPITYKFSKESGLDTTKEMTGFSAQNLKTSIPEAVSEKPDTKWVYTLTKKGTTTIDDEYKYVETPLGTSTLSVSDSAIIATLVNALKEEDAKVQALEARIAILESKVKP